MPPAGRSAIVAWMDARLNPYGLLGLSEGDAHVIRNAGGVVTEDAIRSLAISQRLLGTEEIVLIHHTDCGMLTFKDDDFKASVEAETGIRPAVGRRGVPDLDADVPSRSPRQGQPVHRPQDRPRLRLQVETGKLREVELAGCPEAPAPGPGAACVWAGRRSRGCAPGAPTPSCSSAGRRRPPTPSAASSPSRPRIRAAGLALRARGPGFHARRRRPGDHAGRALVCGWLLRGTLHLVAATTIPGCSDSAPDRFAASRRRLAQEGVSPRQADRACQPSPLPWPTPGRSRAPDLIDRLGGRRAADGRAAAIHLLMLCALRGITLACRARATRARRRSP